MAALSFTLIPNDVTAAPVVAAPTAVMLVAGDFPGNSQCVLECSADGLLWASVSRSFDSRLSGRTNGVYSLPAIPVGWSLRLRARGEATGTVVIE